MPYYEMKCRTCSETSEIRATIAEKTAGALRCPVCGGSDLTQVYRPVQTLKYKESKCDTCPVGASPMSGGCCGRNFGG